MEDFFIRRLLFFQAVLRHGLFDAQDQKSVEVAVAEEKILAVVGDAHPDMLTASMAFMRLV